MFLLRYCNSMLVSEGNDCIPYSGKLCQLVENMIYSEKSFAACSVMLPRDVSPPNFAVKTFADSRKISKFAKVPSFQSFPLYTT